VLVATAHPQDLQAAMAALEPVVGAEIAGAAPDARMTEADTLGVAAAALGPAAGALTLPGNVQTFTQRIDRPVQAVAAPADADVAPMGELGFVGITPVVEEPEPVAAVEEGATTADAPSQDRTETT